MPQVVKFLMSSSHRRQTGDCWIVAAVTPSSFRRQQVYAKPPTDGYGCPIDLVTPPRAPSSTPKSRNVASSPRATRVVTASDQGDARPARMASASQAMASWTVTLLAPSR